jgi:hypothetical protein
MSEDKYPKDLKSEEINGTTVEIQKRDSNLYRATWDRNNHPKFTATAGSKERFLEILKDERGSDFL